MSKLLRFDERTHIIHVSDGHGQSVQIVEAIAGTGLFRHLRTEIGPLDSMVSSEHFTSVTTNFPKRRGTEFID